MEREEQLEPEEGEEKVAFWMRQKSLLHYATLSGNVRLVNLLLNHGCSALINRNDYITGFTPMHVALFTQQPSLVWTLLQHGARIDIKSALLLATSFFSSPRLPGINMVPPLSTMLVCWVSWTTSGTTI